MSISSKNKHILTHVDYVASFTSSRCGGLSKDLLPCGWRVAKLRHQLCIRFRAHTFEPAYYDLKIKKGDRKETTKYPVLYLV